MTVSTTAKQRSWNEPATPASEPHKPPDCAATHPHYYNAGMADRLFTLEEARELLPTVRQLLTEIQAAKGEVDSSGAEMARLLALTGGNGHLQNDLASSRSNVEAAAGRL